MSGIAKDFVTPDAIPLGTDRRVLGAVPTSTANIIRKNVVRIKGVSVERDAVSVKAQIFVVSGKFVKTASLRIGKENGLRTFKIPKRSFQP
jgi:hypothetical protein